jgi:membrane protease subunit HflC
MNVLKVSLLVIGLIFATFLSTFYTVNEGQNALLLRLGKIITDKNDLPIVMKPGLHFKIPFIDRARLFDSRMQQLASSLSQPLTTVTKEQTYLVVEYFAKWRIEDLAMFYKSTGGSVVWAEKLLEQRINDVVRAEYGKRTSDEAISTERSEMILAIREQANHIGKKQGVAVTDVQILQITLPKDVMDSVFKRMATERQQFAVAKRAEGAQKSEAIKALADQRATIIKAQATMRGASLRAKGDLEAATIFANAYNADASFYAFYRSLEAYKASFNSKNDMLILKPDSQFFHYFRNNSGTTDSMVLKK